MSSNWDDDLERPYLKGPHERPYVHAGMPYDRERLRDKSISLLEPDDYSVQEFLDSGEFRRTSRRALYPNWFVRRLPLGRGLRMADPDGPYAGCAIHKTPEITARFEDIMPAARVLVVVTLPWAVPSLSGTYGGMREIGTAKDAAKLGRTLRSGLARRDFPDDCCVKVKIHAPCLVPVYAAMGADELLRLLGLVVAAAPRFDALRWRGTRLLLHLLSQVRCMPDSSHEGTRFFLETQIKPGEPDCILPLYRKLGGIVDYPPWKSMSVCFGFQSAGSGKSFTKEKCFCLTSGREESLAELESLAKPIYKENDFYFSFSGSRGFYM